jgi:hypothetical protein
MYHVSQQKGDDVNDLSVKSPVLLILEDNVDFVHALLLTLKPAYSDHAVLAETNEQCLDAFARMKDRIGLIVFDGNIGKGNSLDTIRTISRSFSGPKIAASSSSELQGKQMEAGCTHKTAKESVGILIRQLLPL